MGDPFGKKNPLPPAQEIEANYLKSKAYFEKGNFEGALDFARKLPKEVPPRYADIRELEKQAQKALEQHKNKLKVGALSPTPVDRLPAALRDSYFDAAIEAQKGNCRGAYDAMVPVSKYLKNREDLEIFKKCRLTQNKNQ